MRLFLTMELKPASEQSTVIGIDTGIYNKIDTGIFGIDNGIDTGIYYIIR